jgi:hypothetical protein
MDATADSLQQTSSRVSFAKRIYGAMVGTRKKCVQVIAESPPLNAAELTDMLSDPICILNANLETYHRNNAYIKDFGLIDITSNLSAESAMILNMSLRSALLSETAIEIGVVLDADLSSDISRKVGEYAWSVCSRGRQKSAILLGRYRTPSFM